MTREDAKKDTRLLQAIEAEVTLIRSLRGEAAVAEMTRVIRHQRSPTAGSAQVPGEPPRDPAPPRLRRPRPKTRDQFGTPEKS